MKRKLKIELLLLLAVLICAGIFAFACWIAYIFGYVALVGWWS